MKIEIIKSGLSDQAYPSDRLAEAFIKKNTGFMVKKLIDRKILFPKVKKLFIIFVSLKDIQALNFYYLKKNRPTDILSFSPAEKDSLGELVLCEQQIKIQAKQHSLLFEEEMMYLILHGLLHLLGYHHEKGGKEAQKMYQLQDSLFNLWLKNQKPSSS